MTTPAAPPHEGWVPTVEERDALLRKYRILASWRRLRDANIGAGDRGHGDTDDGDRGGGGGGEGAAAPDRQALQALSREFPGALRELDVLGLPELQRRIDRLSQSAPPGDEWIAWILAYHATMRTALAAKRAAGRARRISMTVMSAIQRDSEASGVSVDQSFLRAAAHPPGGRLAVLVLRALARRFGVPAAAIATTLFPPRRPSPYQL